MVVVDGSVEMKATFTMMVTETVTAAERASLSPASEPVE